MRGDRGPSAHRARTMSTPGGRTTSADPGCVEVRLLRRLPAEPARLRGRAAGAGRRRPHRPLHRDVTGHGLGSVRRVAGGRLDHDAGRCPPHPGGPGQLAPTDHHRSVRHRRWDPGTAQLRRFGEYAATVYAHPEYIDSLDTSTPISAHVDVDFELHGCPIDRHQLLEVLTASLVGPPTGHPRPLGVPGMQGSWHRLPARQPRTPPAWVR